MRKNILYVIAILYSHFWTNYVTAKKKSTWNMQKFLKQADFSTSQLFPVVPELELGFEVLVAELFTGESKFTNVLQTVCCGLLEYNRSVNTRPDVILWRRPGSEGKFTVNSVSTLFEGRNAGSEMGLGWGYFIHKGYI